MKLDAFRQDLPTSDRRTSDLENHPATEADAAQATPRKRPPGRASKHPWLLHAKHGAKHGADAATSFHRLVDKTRPVLRIPEQLTLGESAEEGCGVAVRRLLSGRGAESATRVRSERSYPRTLGSDKQVYPRVLVEANEDEKKAQELANERERRLSSGSMSAVSRKLLHGAAMRIRDGKALRLEPGSRCGSNPGV